jgi:hypothetical protein
MSLTQTIAGTMSSLSLTSSPIRCSFPRQHGQTSVAGSHDILARRMVGQSTDVARRVRRRLPRRVVVRLDIGFRIQRDGNRCDMTKPWSQLRQVSISPFGARSDQHPFQRLRHRAQFVVLVAELVDHAYQDVRIAWWRGGTRCHGLTLPGDRPKSPGAAGGFATLERDLFRLHHIWPF